MASWTHFVYMCVHVYINKKHQIYTYIYIYIFVYSVCVYIFAHAQMHADFTCIRPPQQLARIFLEVLTWVRGLILY